MLLRTGPVDHMLELSFEGIQNRVVIVVGEVCGILAFGNSVGRDVLFFISGDVHDDFLDRQVNNA